MNEGLTVDDLFRLIGMKEAEALRLGRQLAARDQRIAELEKELKPKEEEEKASGVTAN